MSKCINITLERIGRTVAEAKRVGDLTVTIALICSVNIGDNGIIWASDGKLITLEGGYLIGATG